MNPKQIETTLLSSFDVVRDIGVIMRDGTAHAIMCPNFERLTALGIVNIREFMRLDVIEKYNQRVEDADRITSFSVVKARLPRTPQGDIPQAALPCLLAPRSGASAAGHEPEEQEYQVLRTLLESLKGGPIFPDDHLDIDLALTSLEKVQLRVFLESTLQTNADEIVLLKHATVRALAEYLNTTRRKQPSQLSGVRTPELPTWSSIFQENHTALSQSRFPHTLVLHTAKTFVRSYFRLRAEGLEHLPATQVILAANHQSFFDGFIIARFLSNRFLRNTYVYAGEKHFNTPFRRYIADSSNVIITNINRNLRLSLQKTAAALRQGSHLLIFPEGTRTKTGQLGPFKPTFAILSREFHLPIVPVVIRGAFEAMPVGSHIPKPLKEIQVHFLPPMYPHTMDPDSIAESVRQEMQKYLP